MDVERSLRGLPEVAEPIADVTPDTWQTTIEGTIVRLYERPAPNQYQAGTIRDAEGTERKFVYWQKTHRAHGMPTFRVGDVVRLERVSVNAWQGRVSFALTGDTDVTIDERGDGPKHRSGSTSDQPRIAPWDFDADTHAWLAKVDTARAVALFEQDG